jgi:hypothetical protein
MFQISSLTSRATGRNFASNQLSGAIPASLGNLVSLQQLYESFLSLIFLLLVCVYVSVVAVGLWLAAAICQRIACLALCRRRLET